MKTIEKIKCAAFGLTMLLFSTAIAQEKTKPAVDSYDYTNAIGLRAGETSGLTYKHNFSGGNTFEGIVSMWPYTIGLTGLYERTLHTGTPGLNWYFGGGGHINAGNARSRVYYWNNGEQYVYVRQRNAMALGIDGILGLEYKFRPIPFALSADIKPYIEGSNYGYSYFSFDPSIGLKFTF